MSGQRPVSNLGQTMRSRPIVAQHSWQERFNKLFQPTPMVSFVPLGIPSQRQSAEGFTIDDSADVVSKPTTERMFTEDLMFGAEPTVKMPRIAPANNATPQPTGASFKATVNIPMGDETASCTIEVPTAEFAGADGDEVTARTRKRMADFSAQIISSIVSATQDAESERPKKRQRREASPTKGEPPVFFKIRRTIPMERLRAAIMNHLDIKAGDALTKLYKGKRVAHTDTAETLGMIDNDVVEIHVIDYGTYRESVTMDDDE
ncbi:hypothetical protein LTR09_011352 [Extremus antarcticus]|uniref:Ubiquitin-like domain-containing protein n=1 Tax=Extremus antarcticus TaxID=702011 RepID=A0AAJ0DC58_9PEZI|nr:hypothetical protein LTR09_011352 [Extremus antarcticus]